MARVSEWTKRYHRVEDGEVRMLSPQRGGTPCGGFATSAFLKASTSASTSAFLDVTNLTRTNLTRVDDSVADDTVNVSFAFSASMAESGGLSDGRRAALRELTAVADELLRWALAATRRESQRGCGDGLLDAIADGELLVDVASLAGASCAGATTSGGGGKKRGSDGKGKRDSRRSTPSLNFELFAEACDELGIPDTLRMHRADVYDPSDVAALRRVVNCALALSRMCAVNGVPPPVLREACKRKHPRLEAMHSKGAMWVPDYFSDACLLCRSGFGLMKRK